MLIDLLLGIATTTLCLLLQSLLVVAALRYYARREHRVHSTLLWAETVITGLMLILIFSSLAQIAVWALLFYALGEFETLEMAFYHSGVNFATLGYGDIVMSEKHRLLGPLEAINGALMIGVSTATLSRAFTLVLRGQALSPHQAGTPPRPSKPKAK
ncbi:potassium channel family protein [Microbulbifer magnicolonia]|uniref:potassium channel family protein n=1 Tax=Microbulbifer magnicolonia TaxID=3109744 RepID=UPI002B40BB5F|nr:potassium channel family protein [Microbulbifer sp. GG15]